jgi:2-hydroxy-6-oxonona-2,4-dienedioate hydrolase
MALTLLLLVLLTGAVIAVWISYRRDLARARASATINGRMALTSRGAIEYAEAGDGFPLLSIHGAGGGYDQGLANAVALVGDRFRVIAPSRFGYLGTPLPSETTFAAQADAHAALLDALGINTAIVLGTSAGARSAAALAIRHPDRVAALLLVVPGTYAPTSPLRIEPSRGSAIIFHVVNAGGDFIWWSLAACAPRVLIRFLGVPPTVFTASDQVEQARVMDIVRSVEPLSMRLSGLNIDSQPDSEAPQFERIRSPTLVISARDDLFNTRPAAEYAARKIPGAQLVVFDTGGHLLMGRAQEVRGAIREFLAARSPECVRAIDTIGAQGSDN